MTPGPWSRDKIFSKLTLIGEAKVHDSRDVERLELVEDLKELDTITLDMKPAPLQPGRRREGYQLHLNQFSISVGISVLKKRN